MVNAIIMKTYHNWDLTIRMMEDKASLEAIFIVEKLLDVVIDYIFLYSFIF
jgi:hypothetical protein